MYGIHANIWGILMVNVTIYSSTMDPSWVRFFLSPEPVTKISVQSPAGGDFLEVARTTCQEGHQEQDEEGFGYPLVMTNRASHGIDGPNRNRWFTY